MIFSGNNFLSISDQTGLSFNLNVSLNNSNGICNFGFSGDASKKFNYTMNSGYLFDPENRSIFLYNKNDIINISGNLETGKYSYYLNNQPLCFNGNKDYFKLKNFYIQTQNCQADLNIDIYGNRPNYQVIFNKFIPTGFLTGSLINNSNFDFKIYSGNVSVASKTGFFIDSLSKTINGISSTGVLRINTSGNRQDVSMDNYLLTLNLYTNFGKISQDYNITGEYFKDVNFILSKNNLFSFDILSTLSGLGMVKKYDYSVNFDINSGSSTLVAPYSLPKNLDVKFEYHGGVTGNLTGSLPGVGIITRNLTGTITGYALLENTIRTAITGYDFISGLEKTGFMDSKYGFFTYASGIHKETGILQLTGFLNPNNYYSNINYNESTNIVNGVASYNKYLYDNKYIQNEFFQSNYLKNNLFFGGSIALDKNANTLVVGAVSGDVGSQLNAGRVYVFTGSNNKWREAKLLTGTNISANDYFGQSVSINSSGTIIVVGAPNKDLGTGNLTNAGSVYIFTGYENNWTQSSIITGSNANTGDLFGYSVKISKDGSVIGVGAPNKNLGTGAFTKTGAGAVYLFTGNTNNAWKQSQILTGLDRVNYDGFGTSLAISQDASMIAVGCTGCSLGSLNRAGAVYAFQGTLPWIQFQKITGNNISGFDSFGQSVELNNDGTCLFASSILNDSGKGYVAAFTGNPFLSFSYAQKTRIKPSDNINSGLFGHSICCNDIGSDLFIGAPNHNYGSLTNAGAVYVYTGIDSWLQRQKITGNISNLNSSGKFGYSVACEYLGDNAVIASPFYNSGAFNSLGSIFSFNDVLYSGYLGNFSGTGFVSYPGTYQATGSITGIRYQKTIRTVFDVLSGWYEDNNISGLISFKTGNLILNNSYVSTGNIASGINNLFISVRSMNYYDDYDLTGKLTISGYSNDKTSAGVIIEYITGKK